MSTSFAAVAATPQGASKHSQKFSPASTNTPQGLSPTVSSAPGTQRRSPSPVSEDRDTTVAVPVISLGLASEAAQVSSTPNPPRRLCCLCEDDYHSYAHCPEFTGKEVCLSIVNAPLPVSNPTLEQHPYFRSYLIMMADAWQSVTLGDVHAFLQSATVQVLLRDVPDAEGIEAFLSKHFNEVHSPSSRPSSNVVSTSAHRIRTVVSSLGQMMQMPLLPPYQEGNGGPRPYMMYKGSRFSQCTIADRTPPNTPCYALHISPGGCVDLMLTGDAASRLYSMLGNIQQLLQDLEWQLSLLRHTGDATEEQRTSSGFPSQRFVPPPPLVEPPPPLPQHSPRTQDSRSGSVSPTAPSFSSLLSSSTGSPLLPPTSSPTYPCDSRPYLSMRRDNSGVLLPPTPVPYDAAALASATLPPMVLQWLSSVLRENRAAMEVYHQMRAAGYDGSEGYIPPQYMPQPQPQNMYNAPYQYSYHGNMTPWLPQYSPPPAQQGPNLMPLRGRTAHEPSAATVATTEPTSVAVPPVAEQKTEEVHTPPVSVVPMVTAPSTATRRLNYSTPTATASSERCPRPLAEEKEEDTSVLTQLTTATDVSLLTPEPVAATMPQHQDESPSRTDDATARNLQCARILSTAEVLAQMVSGRVTREVTSSAFTPAVLNTTQPTAVSEKIVTKKIKTEKQAMPYSQAALARYPHIFDLSSVLEFDNSVEYKATIPDIAVLLPILRHAALLFLPFSVRCDQWIRGTVFNYTRLAKSLSDVRDKISLCASEIARLNEETPRHLHPRALPLPDPMYLCAASDDRGTISEDPVLGSTITGAIQPKKLKAVAYRLALGDYAARNNRMISSLIQRKGLKRVFKGSEGDNDATRCLQKFLPLYQRLSRHRTECTIHISFLPLDMPNFVLRMLLDCCGLVLAVRLVACGKKAATGTASADSEAFKMAFVEFSSPQEAQRALQLLHGLRANRLRLRVEAACHSITGCRAEDAMILLAEEEGMIEEKEGNPKGILMSSTTEESSETITEKSTIESPVSAPSAALPCRPGRSVEHVLDSQKTTTIDILLDCKATTFTEVAHPSRVDDNDEGDEPSNCNKQAPLTQRRPTSLDTYLRTPVQLPYRFKHNQYAFESSEYNLSSCSEGLESYSENKSVAATEGHEPAERKNNNENGAALHDATDFYHVPVDAFPSSTQVEAQQQEWERENLSNPLSQTGGSKKKSSIKRKDGNTIASTVPAWVHWCSFGLSYEDMAVAAVAMVELSEHYKGLREEIERRLAESDNTDVIDPDRNALAAAEDFEQIKPKDQIQHEESEMRERRRTDAATMVDTEGDGPSDSHCIHFFLKVFRSAQSFDNFLQKTDSPSSTGITCTVQQRTVMKEIKVIQKTSVAKTADPLPSHQRRRPRRKASVEEQPVDMSGTVTNEVMTNTTTVTTTTTDIHALLRRYNLADVTEEEVRYHFGQLLQHHPRVTLLQEVEEVNNDNQQKGWKQVYCELRCKMSDAAEQQMHQFLDRVLVVSLRTLRSSWGMLADTAGYRGYYAGRSVVLSVPTHNVLMALCDGNTVWQPEAEGNEVPCIDTEHEMEGCPDSYDNHGDHPAQHRVEETGQADISVVSSIRPSGDTEHSLLDTLENDTTREGKTLISSPWTKALALCRVDEEEATATRLDSIVSAVRLCYGATLVDATIQKTLALAGRDDNTTIQSRLLQLLPERSLLHISSAVLGAYDDLVATAKRSAIEQVCSAITASWEEPHAVANPDESHNKSSADNSVNTTNCEPAGAAAARRAEQLCRKLRSLTDPRVTTNVTYTTTQILPGSTGSTAPARSVLRMMQLHRHKPLSGYVAAVSVHACLLLHTAFTEYEQYGNDKSCMDESRHHTSDDFPYEDAMTVLSNTVADLVHYIHTNLQQRFVVLHFAKQMAEEEGTTTTTTTTAEQRTVLSTMVKYAMRETRVFLSNLLQLGMLLEEQAPHLAAEVYRCVWSGVEVLGPVVFLSSPMNNALSRSVLETLCEHCALGRLWLTMREEKNSGSINNTIQAFLAQELPQFPLQAFLVPQSDYLPTSFIEQTLHELGINV